MNSHVSYISDVDECQQAGGLYGHHCHSNTRCVNVFGGYVCQCLPGYTRRDKFSCVEVTDSDFTTTKILECYYTKGYVPSIDCFMIKRVNAHRQLL